MLKCSQIWTFVVTVFVVTIIGSITATTGPENNLLINLSIV